MSKLINKKIKLNPSELLQQARQALKNGKLHDAIAIAEQILQQFPLHIDTHYWLAQRKFDLGLYEEALYYLRIALTASNAKQVNKQVYHDILNKYFLTKQYVLLEQASLWLTQFATKDSFAWDYLGLSLIEQGRFDEAHAALQNASVLSPTNPHILCNLGNALISLGRSEEAIPYLMKAISLAPQMAVAYNNLGNAQRSVCDTQSAIESLHTAIKLAPNVGYQYNNLGLAYRENQMYEEAIKYFVKALQLEPGLVQVYPGLIESLTLNGQVQQAIDCCEEVMSKCDHLPEFWGAFGDALMRANHLDAAIKAFIRALGFKTDEQSEFNRKKYSNLLFCLNYHPDLSAEAIYDAYREFNTRFCQPLVHSWRAFDNEREPNKKLKIGYVGPVFYNHVCKYFLIPLLEQHDQNQVEIFIYAGMPFEDDITKRYKTLAQHWISTRNLSDVALVERIRSDQIDILVDLAGHVNDNRLPVFARKPAPVSVHWLEYGYTTGLSAIDYYMTDQATATGHCAHLFSEKIWCLDGPAIVYRPDTWRADLTESPASKTGIVTFGSLSRSTRINHRVIKLWAAILDAMPNSRLIINSGDFKDVQVQEEMASRFTRYGIDRSRLEIGFSTPSWEVLKHIDIGLDCFPHNSGTTLLETLYMGIPFVTLTDRPSVGRIGASVLTGMGRTEWIANTEEEYAQKAIVLAHDIDGLVYMRQHLRQEMEASALMNEPAFARSVEKAYRQMWQRYCEESET